MTVLCPGAVRTELTSREHDRLARVRGGEPWAVAPGGGGRRRDWGPVSTPAEVAAAAVAAVEQDRFFVFTNPGSRARVEARLGPILDALGDRDGPSRPAPPPR